MTRFKTARDARERIEHLAYAFEGTLGVAALNLSTGESIQWNGRAIMPTASVIKVPLLLALLRDAERGKVGLDERLQLDSEFSVGGSGILKVLEGGLRPTIKDVAILMIALSDNTATNMILGVVGGVDAVNSAMDDLGILTCRMHNSIDFDVIGSDVRRLGESSTADLCEIMRLIAKREAFSEGVSVLAEEVLATQQYLDQVPRYVLYNPFAQELGLTSPITVANKTGFFTGTRVDSGIVRFGHGGGFVYAVANDESDDKSFLPEAQGSILNGLVGRSLVECWWPSDAGVPPLSDTMYLSGVAKD